VGEHDLELLSTTEKLHQQVRLARAYFSGFNPIEGTPLENVPACNPWRQNRLYQASFLLRDYAFNLEELPFSSEGDLPLGVDPKRSWADMNLIDAPIELNRAGKLELMRVPGIGPKRAATILSSRRHHRLRSLHDLKALGISPHQVAAYILLDGRKPPVQLSLF
jgi:predicted DNA-binding helix-hairpin-helix protein